MNRQVQDRRARSSKLASLALPFTALALLVAGCWDDKPCDPGQVIIDNSCYPPPKQPVTPMREPDAGQDAAGPTPMAKPNNFGEKCSQMSDCASGAAPICGAPQLPMCIQINCEPGEENAGACPAGWRCTTIPPNPSVCLKSG